MTHIDCTRRIQLVLTLLFHFFNKCPADLSQHAHHINVCEGNTASLHFAIEQSGIALVHVYSDKNKFDPIVMQERTKETNKHYPRISVMWEDTATGTQIDVEIHNVTLADRGTYTPYFYPFPRIFIGENATLNVLHDTACPSHDRLKYPHISYRNVSNYVIEIRNETLYLIRSYVSLLVTIPPADPPVLCVVSTAQVQHTCTGRPANDSICEVDLFFGESTFEEINITMQFITYQTYTTILHVQIEEEKKIYTSSIAPGDTSSSIILSDTKLENTSSMTALVVAVLVVFIVILLVISVSMFIWRRQKRSEEKEPNAHTGKSYTINEEKLTREDENARLLCENHSPDTDHTGELPEDDQDNVDLLSAARCLIYTGQDGKVQVDDKCLQQLTALPDKSLVVVAMVGTYRTGKSYLLNRLAGDNAGFALGYTIESKTKGIWILVKEHPVHSDRYLVLLDTEGLEDTVKGDSTHDCMLFCLATLLSSVLVYNAMGAINEDALAKLNLIGEMSKHIRTHTNNDCKNSDEDFDLYFPQLVYVLRDFTLQLVINNVEVTADEYLEQSLKLKPDIDEETRRYNLPRECIRKYFKERNCFTFDRPAAGRKQLDHLDKLSDDHLSSDFLEETKLFCNYINNHGVVKKLDTGRGLNGRMWSCLVRLYVDAIRAGTVPCIENAVSAMAKIENSKAIERAIEVYKKLVNGVVLPTPDDRTLSKAHFTALSDAIKEFLKKAVFDTEFVFQIKLKEQIEKIYQRLKLDNQEKSRSKCENLLQHLEGSIQKKISDGNYLKEGGNKEYNDDIGRLEDRFKKDKTLGVMADEVLNEYINKMMQTGEGIAMAYKKIDKEQQRAELSRKAAEAASKQLELTEVKKRKMENEKRERAQALKDELQQLADQIKADLEERENREKAILDQRLAEQKRQLEEGYLKKISDIKSQIEQKRKEMNQIQKEQRSNLQEYEKSEKEKQGL